MKHLFFYLVLFWINHSTAQNVIIDYSDERLPSKLAASIDKITVSDFESYVDNDTAREKYGEKRAVFIYSVKYAGGYIIGQLGINIAGKALSYEVKLPFQYCCNHNPKHCADTKEQIIKNQETYKCGGWKRAQL